MVRQSRTAVLVVEPDAEKRHALLCALHRDGYVALSAAGVDDACLLVEAAEPPLGIVVSGIELLREGRELAAALCSRHADVVVVHTCPWTPPVRGLRGLFVGSSAPADEIVRVVDRLQSRPNSELSKT